MNNRAAIRAAVKALLSGQTDAGTNVYTNRETKLWQSELPAILIYTPTEPIVPEALQGTRYYRTLELQVKIKLEATSSIDDDLDDLAADVEDLMSADRSFGGTVISSIQTNTEISIDSAGENDVGMATLTFECKYIS